MTATQTLRFPLAQKHLCPLHERLGQGRSLNALEVWETDELTKNACSGKEGEECFIERRPRWFTLRLDGNL